MDFRLPEGGTHTVCTHTQMINVLKADFPYLKL